MLWSLALLPALSACESPALRARSLECNVATLIAPGAACQPMERMPDAADADAKRFAPSADKAHVYVVRPSIVGGRYPWIIQVDGKPVGAVAEHTYLLLKVEPGHHEIAVQTGENRHGAVVDAKAGDIHFLELVSRLGWTESKAEVRAVGRSAGESAVRSARRVDPF